MGCNSVLLPRGLFLFCFLNSKQHDERARRGYDNAGQQGEGGGAVIQKQPAEIACEDASEGYHGRDEGLTLDGVAFYDDLVDVAYRRGDKNGKGEGLKQLGGI